MDDLTRLEDDSYTIRTNNSREFPIDQFSRKEWRVLSLFFREKKSYQFIVKAVRISMRDISKVVKRAIRYCPKLTEHRTVTFTKEKNK